LKQELYGEAGIPFLLFVEPNVDFPAMRLLELSGDGYREIATGISGLPHTMTPFPLTLDVGGSR
jgi:hypothetical protein